MLNNGKAWWTLILIQCVFMSVVLGAYWGIKTNMVALRGELRLLQLRVESLEKALKNPNAPSHALVDADEFPSAASGSNSPSPDKRMPGATAPGANGDTKVIELDKSRESPTCVNKMTHVVFSCDRASKCLGSNNFDVAYFNNLRAKLGLRDSDSMMICDERSADSEPSSQEGTAAQ